MSGSVTLLFAALDLGKYVTYSPMSRVDELRAAGKLEAAELIQLAFTYRTQKPANSKEFISRESPSPGQHELAARLADALGDFESAARHREKALESWSFALWAPSLVKDYVRIGEQKRVQSQPVHSILKDAMLSEKHGFLIESQLYLGGREELKSLLEIQVSRHASKKVSKSCREKLACFYDDAEKRCHELRFAPAAAELVRAGGARAWFDEWKKTMSFEKEPGYCQLDLIGGLDSAGRNVVDETLLEHLTSVAPHYISPTLECTDVRLAALKSVASRDTVALCHVLRGEGAETLKLYPGTKSRLDPVFARALMLVGRADEAVPIFEKLAESNYKFRLGWIEARIRSGERVSKEEIWNEDVRFGIRANSNDSRVIRFLASFVDAVSTLDAELSRTLARFIVIETGYRRVPGIKRTPELVAAYREAWGHELKIWDAFEEKAK